jgi:hypothetical protein
MNQMEHEIVSHFDDRETNENGKEGEDQFYAF